mgnify:CR=1 FL=1
MLAGNIAYGTLKAIKVYDFSNVKITKLYFHSNATHQDEASCNGVARITHSLHGASTERMISIALSGYIANRKVRAYSENAGSCEADFLSISDTHL